MAKKTKQVISGYATFEPMVLLSKQRELTDQIKALIKEKKLIQRELKRRKIQPLRSAYYDKPILLYVLKLENGCWYVGMTRDMDRRYKAHQKGKTIWTGLHKPITIHETRETGLTNDSEAALLEDQLTLEYAREYGTDYVRGGGYAQRKPVWPKEAYNIEPDLSWIR